MAERSASGPGGPGGPDRHGGHGGHGGPGEPRRRRRRWRGGRWLLVALVVVGSGAALVLALRAGDGGDGGGQGAGDRGESDDGDARDRGADRQDDSGDGGRAGDAPSSTRDPGAGDGPAGAGDDDRQAPDGGAGEGGEGAVRSRWRPRRGLTWQWQLDGGPIDTSVDADVYDVDLFTTPAETVADLHRRGRRVICYLSAGSWEPYRPDADAYPDEVIGGPVEGWPDERWLDIRRRDVLRPILAARFDLCARKGFDGVEPDWMDSHEQDTGFPITADDQLRFNRMLAELAHERGLAIGLKNDLGQAAELADLFDFAVVEQCAEFGECGELAPFLDRGKPVFHAEYDLPVSQFCAESRRLGLSSIRKRIELDPWRETC